MEKEKLRATPAARQMAKILELDLINILGSGENGRIHKDDVISYNENKKPKITPLAKKMAILNNIDIENVKGSGFKGKIQKEDILALLGSVVREEKKEAKKEEVKENVVKTEKALDTQEDFEIIPMNAMRKVISKRMSESFFTAPTFTLNYEIDMLEIKKLREKLLATILQKTGFKITYTDLIAMAVAKTLEKPEHKFLNSSITEDGKGIKVHKHVSLSLAVGFDDNLLTPVLKDTNKKTITEIVIGLKELTKKALEMKLSPSEMSGSTFTISNLGMYGVKSFNPIINQPNVAILGISAMVDKPVVVNGEIVVRPIMQMSLTIDHRIVDGLAGAKFMQDLKGLLENPIMMLI
mgnify:FL=1